MWVFFSFVALEKKNENCRIFRSTERFVYKILSSELLLQRQKHTHTHTHTNKQTNKQANKQTIKQTNKHKKPERNSA